MKIKSIITALFIVFALANFFACADSSDQTVLQPTTTNPNITSVDPSSGAVGSTVTLSIRNYDASKDLVIFNKAEVQADIVKAQALPIFDYAKESTSTNLETNDLMNTMKDVTNVTFKVPDSSAGAVMIKIKRGDFESDPATFTVQSSFTINPSIIGNLRQIITPELARSRTAIGNNLRLLQSIKENSSPKVVVVDPSPESCALNTKPDTDNLTCVCSDSNFTKKINFTYESVPYAICVKQCADGEVSLFEKIINGEKSAEATTVEKIIVDPNTKADSINAYDSCVPIS